MGVDKTLKAERASICCIHTIPREKSEFINLYISLIKYYQFMTKAKHLVGIAIDWSVRACQRYDFFIPLKRANLCSKEGVNSILVTILGFRPFS